MHFSYIGDVNVLKGHLDMFINLGQACGHWKIGKNTYSIRK